MTDLESLMPLAFKAIDVAREVATRKPHFLRSKGDRDMVSDIDIDVEHAVRAYLRAQTPHIDFLGEEEGSLNGTSELLWALDPIDGTANFIRQIPLYAISLALVDHEAPVLGVIDLPALGSRYSAVARRGANANGIGIQVSSTTRLHDALVTIGDYAVGRNASARNRLRLAVTEQLAQRALRVRMFGSAAIDLAWVAEGKTDACIILGGHPWDIAAGVILAREAGAQVVDLDGASHTIRSKATVAASPALLNEILALLNDAKAST